MRCYFSLHDRGVIRDHSLINRMFIGMHVLTLVFDVANLRYNKRTNGERAC